MECLALHGQSWHYSKSGGEYEHLTAIYNQIDKVSSNSGHVLQGHVGRVVKISNWQWQVNFLLIPVHEAACSCRLGEHGLSLLSPWRRVLSSYIYFNVVTYFVCPSSEVSDPPVHPWILFALSSAWVGWVTCGTSFPPAPTAPALLVPDEIVDTCVCACSLNFKFYLLSHKTGTTEACWRACFLFDIVVPPIHGA